MSTNHPIKYIISNKISMYQKNITPIIQSLLLATMLSSGLWASACSAESSNTQISPNQSTPTEIYKHGLAYYEGDSVTEDDDNAFELFQKAAWSRVTLV